MTVSFKYFIHRLTTEQTLTGIDQTGLKQLRTISPRKNFQEHLLQTLMETPSGLRIGQVRWRLHGRLQRVSPSLISQSGVRFHQIQLRIKSRFIIIFIDMEIFHDFRDSLKKLICMFYKYGQEPRLRHTNFGLKDNFFKKIIFRYI